MSKLSNSRKIDLPQDILELACRRAVALDLSLNDYISKLVVSNALRLNTTDIHVSEAEHLRLLQKLEASRSVSTRIKLAALNLDRNGF